MGRLTRVAERAVIGALALTVAAAAMADEEAPRDYGQRADTLGTPEPEAASAGLEAPRGRLSLAIGNDITTAYFFRGILQERTGFIDQPYVELGVRAFEGDGLVRSAAAGIGLWMSVQTAETDATHAPRDLYELDVYPSLTVAWAGGLTTSATYIWYTSPSGAFSTEQELTLGLAYDDTALLGPFSVGPTATLGFETVHSALGSTQGGYLELAGAPHVELSLPMDDAGAYRLTVTFPLAVGLSLYDYYAFAGRNQTFGFFSFGVNAGIPLAFIPENFGAWTVNAGITVLVLSQTLEQINHGDNPFPVGTLSLSLAY